MEEYREEIESLLDEAFSNLEDKEILQLLDEIKYTISNIEEEIKG